MLPPIHTPPSPSTLCQHAHFLCLSLCPANSFISIIFLDSHIYAVIFGIYFSLPREGKVFDRDLLHSKLWELVMDREAWRAAVHGVSKSWTRLSGWTELPVNRHGRGTKDKTSTYWESVMYYTLCFPFTIIAFIVFSCHFTDLKCICLENEEVLFISAHPYTDIS